MAANKITQEFYSFLNFTNDGFKYNLQVFPDTLTAAALLFALLFQSPPLATFGGSIALLNVLHPPIARFITSFISGTKEAPSIAQCSGQFPGLSYERLIGAASSKSFGELSDTNFPSYYTTFLGFIAAYIGMLPFIYSDELKASPKRQTSTVLGLVVLGLVILTGLVYRIMSSCDSMFNAFVGLVVGGMLGAFIVGFIAFISERRLTNILSMPLLRSKAGDGKPIYVCERTQ